MLDGASPPVCVGLYANWGSGKSFLMHRLKMCFDDSVIEDPRTFQMVQWFEPSYAMLKAAKQEENIETLEEYLENGNWFPLFVAAIIFPFILLISLIFELCYVVSFGFCLGYFGSLQSIMDLIDSVRKGCLIRVFICRKWFGKSYLWWGEVFTELSTKTITEALFSRLPYSAQTILKIGGHIFTSSCFSALWSGDETYVFRKDNDEEMQAPKVVTKENIFTDFNAWEFSQTDELWVGIVSKTYERIELRLEKHQQRDESTGKTRRIDFKAKWRVEKAVDLLMKQYGGPRQVGLRILSAFILLCSVPVVVWVITVYHTFIGAWFVLVGFLAPLVPVVRFFISSSSYTGVSRGEVLFQQAKGNKV